MVKSHGLCSRSKPQHHGNHSRRHAEARYTPSFINKIEAELAGSDERGVKPPQVRIPGKNHLSAVLLTNNPWEQRDLDRKLERIAKERDRREKALDWNQRHFFTQQIFDPDYHLRFTTTRSSYSLQETERYGDPQPAYVYGQEENYPLEKSDKLPEISTTGRGIFTKPQEWNLPSRRIRRTRSMPIKQTYKPDTQRSQQDESSEKTGSKLLGDQRSKVRSGSPTPGSEEPEPVTRVSCLIHNGTRETKSVTDQSDEARKYQVTSGDQLDIVPTFPTEPRDEDITECDVKHKRPMRVRKSYTTILEIVPEVPSSCEGAPPEHHTPRLQKSLSLPQINLKGSKSIRRLDISRDRPPGTPSNESSSTGSQSSRTEQQVTPPNDSICDEDVISRITQTLPVSLMVRANQNINKIVMKRKDRMLRKCRERSQRDMFQDPRWYALKSVLISMDHTVTF